MGNKRSNLENAAIAAGVAGATFALGLGVRKIWRWFNREELPAPRQVAPPAPLPPAPSPSPPPSPDTDDGVIRPDFSGFRRSRSSTSSTSSTPSSPSPPRPTPEPEPEPLVEPWMKEWAAKVAEGMGIKS